VDDLQWVDRPSLSWLAYLGPRAEESPMLVVLSVREGDPRGRANLVASAADDSSVRRVGLSALSATSVAALVRAELGSAASTEFCSGCWELAGGNPLFVRELLAAAHNEGLSGAQDSVTELRALASSAVGASVLGRLARLGPDAVALAQALAVLGSQTEVGIAAELAGLESAAAELTADRLAAAQILAPARPLDRRARAPGRDLGRAG
jgi:predicted ATPase